MSSIYTRLSTDNFFRLGYMFQQQGDLYSAVECYNKSIQRSPSAEAHTFLGWTLSLLGEIDGAIEECKKAVGIDPQFGNALNDLGVYYLKKRNFTKAVSYLKRACRAKNYDTPAFPHFNLSLVYAQQGMLRAASKELKTSIEKNPTFQPARSLLEEFEGSLH